MKNRMFEHNEYNVLKPRKGFHTKTCVPYIQLKLLVYKWDKTMFGLWLYFESNNDREINNVILYMNMSEMEVWNVFTRSILPTII